MASVPVIDYVVVHELVHIKVKNHSKEFWGKVKLIIPKYRQRIEWLEKNGHLLVEDVWKVFSELRPHMEEVNAAVEKL